MRSVHADDVSFLLLALIGTIIAAFFVFATVMLLVHAGS